ncbi:MAG TPA: F0F1 ATP synthase subunit A [Streptosporangiaceae bacterium]|nr:F0F1 ATP synthase subunit A [Streptosporangiaceae bacterium]
MAANVLAAAVAAKAAKFNCDETNSHLNTVHHCGYPAPSYPGSFTYGPLFRIGDFTFNKPMLLACICAVIVIAFFWSAFSKPKIVPRGVQNVAEIGVFFVRDQILRPMMGKKGDNFLPFLVSLFFFIWIMNIMEIIPAAQFPPMSEIAFPACLMLMVYGTYTYLGIKRQGLGGYFANMIPRGVPIGILTILAPVEILQYTIIRPFTLAVRLFANMFAGHILLLVFTLATWYLLSAGIGLLWSATSFLLTIIITAFEMLIQGLQAYIFTILTAQYIGGSLESEH